MSLLHLLSYFLRRLFHTVSYSSNAQRLFPILTFHWWPYFITSSKNWSERRILWTSTSAFLPASAAAFSASFSSVMRENRHATISSQASNCHAFLPKSETWAQKFSFFSLSLSVSRSVLNHPRLDLQLFLPSQNSLELYLLFLLCHFFASFPSSKTTSLHLSPSFSPVVLCKPTPIRLLPLYTSLLPVTPSSWIPSFFLDLLLLALSVLFDPADRSFHDFYLCYSSNSANCFSCLFSFSTIPQLSSFVSSCLCVFSSLQLCFSFILLISILTSFTFCSYFSSPNLSHFSDTEFFQIIFWSQRDLTWNIAYCKDCG